MPTKKPFSKDIILLNNVEAVVNEIVQKLQQDVLHNLKRLGAVVGISGGIDSSVCLALAAKAFGPEKVLGIMIPEKDSSPDSERLAQKLADKFGVKAIREDITSALSGYRCYERRDEAVKRIFPEYDPQTFKMKIGPGMKMDETAINGGNRHHTGHVVIINNPCEGFGRNAVRQNSCPLQKQ